MKEQLTYGEYLEEVTERISERLGEDYNVSLTKIPKNNGIIRDALTIRKGNEAIAPTVYIDDAYKRVSGCDIDTAVDEILATLAYAEKCDFPEEAFSLEFEDVKDRIVYKLINYEKNKEMLENMPHIRFLDLAITFHIYVVNSQNQMSSVRIGNDIMERLGTDLETLYSYADRNTPGILKPTLRTMLDVLFSIRYRHPKGESDHDCEAIRTMVNAASERIDRGFFFIASNDMSSYGAAVLIYPDFVEILKKCMCQEYYLVPSSVHEILMFPKREVGEKKELSLIQREVNSKEVVQTDVLSNELYEMDEVISELGIIRERYLKEIPA